MATYVSPTIDQLLHKASYLSGDNRDLVRRAYVVAEEQHRGQIRSSGEPYITHPLAVADILCNLGADAETLAAGLLHDVVEDTGYPPEQIAEQFGKRVRELVLGVTKLSKQTRSALEPTDNHPNGANGGPTARPDPTRQEEWAENMRQLFLSSGEHPLILVIKLADRLHNMLTLTAIKNEDKRRRIAKETLEIFAPVANRLGMWQIKWELEDLAFRHLQPVVYQQLREKINQRRAGRERFIRQVEEQIRLTLTEHSITADVSGRPKHIYSIWRKMQQKGIPFEEVYDVHGFRIIVSSVTDCYVALGIIHTLWRPIPGEFDDYIARPKDNGYQSLHTAVTGPEKHSMEVQIRTWEMHDLAEQGVAAHWRYKEGGRKFDDDFANKIAWLRALKTFEEEANDASEMVESMRTDIFSDRVYVFTPKGDLLNLPAGSTPIDFAYQIHTEVGHRCRGARVNGKMVRLDYQLKSRDRVEIITAKKAGPSRDWLNEHLGYVRTRRARSKIRQWFRTQDREANIIAGRQTLDRLIKQLYLRSVSHEDAAQAMGYDNLDDFLAAIGYGDIPSDRLSSKLIAMQPKDRDEDKAEDEGLPDVAPPPNASGPIAIRGVDGLLTRLAQCCNPLPGDDIVGYVTRGRGVTIHKAECPNVMNRNQEQERMIQAHWGAETPTYPVPIIVRAWNRTGLLRDISAVVAADGINISASSTNTSPKSPLAVIFLTMSVRDAQQLTRIMDRVERVQNVISVERYRPEGGKGKK
ncbi:MAG: bifunctional (p)ppGpp synthetase/guanosine-3',5'-bis(diphosphate) 3'-pyrophosphohydrolase [Caldilineales bacterium]|nr:bifunctional (p)ppGpp synthetase/guanosine-3',5'-bis(diphosphate) 3'-pyrophosphohydrolase [Caldilineales bacterium]MCW5858615.1 bifunctional (p)ppGpp synthetase/guanosine-3',5'-bis(diphosphate) 3'-pyrophosphohydrolase [Caldilineales bacterium]